MISGELFGVMSITLRLDLFGVILLGNNAFKFNNKAEVIVLWLVFRMLPMPVFLGCFSRKPAPFAEPLKSSLSKASFVLNLNIFSFNWVLILCKKIRPFVF